MDTFFTSSSSSICKTLHVVVELNLQDALFFLLFHNLNSLNIKLVIQRD